MVQLRYPPVVPSLEADIEVRASMVRHILGSLALEGQTPSPDVIAWSQQFVAGEMTAEELDEAIVAKYASPKTGGL